MTGPPVNRSRRLKWALLCDLTIAVAEVVGGALAHSAGLFATAGHDLADAGALGLALVATSLVTRPARRRARSAFTA